MKKRGAIELQFNWMFVLIAGAVFFAFFYSIIHNQSLKSDYSLNVELIQKLDTIIKGTQQNYQTYSEITMPNAKLEFTCEGDTSDFRIYKTGVKIDTPVELIFSPGLIESNRLLTWTQDWNVPYKAATFVYVTSPNILYVFVNDSEDIREVYNEVPANITKKLINPFELSTVNGGNYKKYRFIFTGTTPQVSLSSNKADVTAIQITKDTSTSDVFQVGTVKFYKYVNPGFSQIPNEYHYLKQASLYGAVFSENGDMYECVMNKALKKFRIVNQVYLGKVTILETELGNTHPCFPFLSSPHTNLDYVNKTLGTSPNTATIDFPALSILSKSLEDDNMDLRKGNNCPLVY